MNKPPLETTIPPFAPRFVDEPGMARMYQDGRITAAVDIHEGEGARQLVISEWSSAFRNCGCSVQALQWFRDQGFDSIVANGVGTLDEDEEGNLVGDIATVYWAHMKTKGLVDVLLDDEGTELEVDAEENVTFKAQASKKAMRP